MSSNPNDAPKRIVVCSDGTGNAGGRLAGSNVWRIRQAVLRRDQSEFNQIVLYEDGVGTQPLAPVRLLGNAFGFGLKQDLRLLYGKLIREFDVRKRENGSDVPDELFLFGFSRGAFTIRTFANLIYRCGIADIRDVNGHRLRPEQVDAIVDKAIQAYELRIRQPDAPDEFRMRFGRKWKCGDLESKESTGRFPIRFIGVWDTVSAVGLPFENVTQQLTKWGCPFFRWNLRRRGHYSKWEDDLHPWIENAYQAIAIDDERQTFFPMLWLEFKHDGTAEDPEKREIHKSLLTTPAGQDRKVEQVWFPGMHSNIGGGYPKDQMAYISLDWMMRHASREGLKFDAQMWHEFTQQRDDLGKMYDSRSGMGALYRFKRRSISNISAQVGLDGSSRDDGRRKPRIHASTFRRIKFGATDYAPAGVPLMGSYLQVDDPPVDIDKTNAESQLPPQETGDIDVAPVSLPDMTGDTSVQQQPQKLVHDERVFVDHSVSAGESPDASWRFDEQHRQQAEEVACSGDKVTREQAEKVTNRLLALRRTTFHLFYAWLFALIATAFVYMDFPRSRGFWFESRGNEWEFLIPVVGCALMAGICQVLRLLTDPDRDKNAVVNVTGRWITAGFLRDGFVLAAFLIGIRPLVVSIALWTLPDVASPMLNAVGQSSLIFAVFGLVLYTLFCLRAALRRQTRAVNVPAWLNAMGIDAAPYRKPFWMRFSGATEWPISVWIARRFEQIVEPGVALAIVAGICIAAFTSSVGGVIMDCNVVPFGKIGEVPANVRSLEDIPNEVLKLSFDTRKVLATGLKVRPGQVYQIAVEEVEDWKDKTLDANHMGQTDPEHPIQKASKWLKRIPSTPYMRLLGCVGRPDASPFVITSGQFLTVDATGELFLHVNDVPGAYHNNKGTAQISISLIANDGSVE